MLTVGCAGLPPFNGWCFGSIRSHQWGINLSVYGAVRSWCWWYSMFLCATLESGEIIRCCFTRLKKFMRTTMVTLLEKDDQIACLKNELQHANEQIGKLPWNMKTRRHEIKPDFLILNYYKRFMKLRRHKIKVVSTNPPKFHVALISCFEVEELQLVRDSVAQTLEKEEILLLHKPHI